jgi:hypothetical protein
MHGLYESGGSIYNNNTNQVILSACTDDDKSSHRFHRIQTISKLLKPQISQQHPSRICFITLGWHITRDLNLLSLTMGVNKNSNLSLNNSVYKKIMALKSNQLQVTSHNPQTNAIIERVHKVVNSQ